MAHPINIVVAAQNTLFIDLVKAAVVAHGHNLLASYQHLHQEESLLGCDVLVVHLSSVDSAEVKVIEALARTYPDMGIIVLCVQSGVEDICDALGATVNAIIADDKPVEVLISALQIVSNGFKIVHPNQTSLLAGTSATAQHLRDTIPSEARDLLSERELTILVKVHDGFSNKEIARQFQISDSTVKAHLRSIFQKTGLRNRTQAAIWASSIMSSIEN